MVEYTDIYLYGIIESSASTCMRVMKTEETKSLFNSLILVQYTMIMVIIQSAVRGAGTGQIVTHSS